MSDSKQKCTFCPNDCTIEPHPNVVIPDPISGERLWIPILKAIDCPSCGKIYLGERASQEIAGLPDNIKQFIPIFLHNDTLSGPSGEKLLTEDSYHLGYSWHVTIGEMVRKIRRYTVTERLNRALLSLAQRSNQVGYNFYISENERTPHGGLTQRNTAIENPYALFAENLKAAEWILHTLHNQGYLQHEHGICVLTADGWKRVEELTSRISDSPQAFVAMWFDNQMDELYEKGIAPAITIAGYEPYRVKGRPTDQKVDDEIIAQIRRSRFVVADFKGQRPAVYFEAGFAMGMGIRVIWTCHKDEIENLSFDTRQYGHILWDKPENLKQDLVNHIEARIGHGPLS